MHSLKNSIVVGVVVFAAVYGYYWYVNNNNVLDAQIHAQALLQQGSITPGQADTAIKQADSGVQLFNPVLAGVAAGAITYLMCEYRSGSGVDIPRYHDVNTDGVSEVNIEIVPIGSSCN